MQRGRGRGHWVLFGDAFIARIHRRVLHHIAANAEAALKR
jgi:hypothetical protein